MNDLEDAISRLTAWLRDHGANKANAWVGDVTMVVTAAREASAIKSNGIKMAAFCARLHGREDIPRDVKSEAIALANEFKTVIVDSVATNKGG